MKKFENVFIWLAGAVFAIAAIATVAAYIFGLVLYIGGYLQ